MGIRTLTAVVLTTALLGLTMIVAPAGSAVAEGVYVFPSTNDANRAAGFPHLNQLPNGPGAVTLEFVKRPTRWRSSSPASMASPTERRPTPS